MNAIFTQGVLATRLDAPAPESPKEPSLPDHFEEARGNLVPRVAPRFSAEAARLKAKLDERGTSLPLQVPLADHLTVSFRCQHQGAEAVVNQAHAEKWGVSPAEVLEAAVAKLGAEYPQSQQWLSSFAGRGFYFSRSGPHPANLLLLPDVVRQCSVEGNPVAMTHRGTLCIGGDEEPDVLEHMAYLCSRDFTDFGLAFRLTPSGWSPWLPERDSRAYAPFKELRDETLYLAYNRLGRLVKKEREAVETEPVCVSRFMHRIDVAGVGTSVSVVKKGFVSFIPLTDRVAFAEVDGDAQPTRVVAQASWDRVAEVLGSKLEPIEGYPVRYRVGEFPIDEQLRRIGHA